MNKLVFVVINLAWTYFKVQLKGPEPKVKIKRLCFECGKNCSEGVFEARWIQEEAKSTSKSKTLLWSDILDTKPKKRSDQVKT